MKLKFNHVDFYYGDKAPNLFQALNDIDCEIKENSFTCIVGHTGCGKSTMIQQLNGLLIPTKGSVFAGDFVVSNNKKERTKKLKPLRQKVGIVFQFSEYQLFENTVEEDVAFGPTNFGVKREDALKLAHENLLKVGLNESFFKKSPFDLSGGERRRVAIAGIMAMQPEVIVLDEPTVGLDPRGVKEMMNLFKQLHEQGTTIIVVTHDMNLVYGYATDVIVMDHGKIVYQGAPNDLFNQSVDEYSLETPLITKLIQELEKKGYEFDLSKITSIDDVVDAIATQRRSSK